MPCPGAVAPRLCSPSQVRSPLRSSCHPLMPFILTPPVRLVRFPNGSQGTFPVGGLSLRQRAGREVPAEGGAGCGAGCAQLGCGCGWGVWGIN